MLLIEKPVSTFPEALSAIWLALKVYCCCPDGAAGANNFYQACLWHESRESRYDGSMPVLTPANPDFDAVVRASFTKQGFLKTIGAELALIAAGRVIIRCPFSDQVSQQHGFFHGAVIGAIADSAGGYAALSLMSANSEVVTVEYKINFLMPAKGEWLEARGEVTRAGNSLFVTRVDVHILTLEGPKHCAAVQQTLSRIKFADPEPG